MISLNQLDKAFDYSQKTGNLSLVQEIGTVALRRNQVDLAIRCFREIQNVSMVLSLKKLQRRSAHSLGYLADLAMILCDYPKCLQFSFLAGDFAKVVFLCEELNQLDLGLDLLRFVQSRAHFGTFFLNRSLGYSARAPNPHFALQIPASMRSPRAEPKQNLQVDLSLRTSLPGPERVLGHTRSAQIGETKDSLRTVDSGAGVSGERGHAETLHRQ